MGCQLCPSDQIVMCSLLLTRVRYFVYIDNEYNNNVDKGIEYCGNDNGENISNIDDYHYHHDIDVIPNRDENSDSNKSTKVFSNNKQQ